MNIIGITGKAGSGKNTVTAFLAAILNEQGYSVRIDSFVGGMKKFIHKHFNWDGSKDDFWRRVLQEFGIKKRDLNENYWIADLSERLLTYSKYAPDFIIIPDVRFENEADFIRDNGMLWAVLGRGGLSGANGSHKSEAIDFPLVRQDVVIKNESSLEDLKTEVEFYVKRNLHISQ